MPPCKASSSSATVASHGRCATTGLPVDHSVSLLLVVGLLRRDEHAPELGAGEMVVRRLGLVERAPLSALRGWCDEGSTGVVRRGSRSACGRVGGRGRWVVARNPSSLSRIRRPDNASDAQGSWWGYLPTFGTSDAALASGRFGRRWMCSLSCSRASTSLRSRSIASCSRAEGHDHHTREGSADALCHCHG